MAKGIDTYVQMSSEFQIPQSWPRREGTSALQGPLPLTLCPQLVVAASAPDSRWHLVHGGHSLICSAQQAGLSPQCPSLVQCPWSLQAALGLLIHCVGLSFGWSLHLSTVPPLPLPPLQQLWGLVSVEVNVQQPHSQSWGHEFPPSELMGQFSGWIHIGIMIRRQQTFVETRRWQRIFADMRRQGLPRRNFPVYLECRGT